MWVPVGKIYTNASKATTTITLDRYSFSSTGKPSKFTSTAFIEETKEEDTKNGYENTAAIDINAFKNSVSKNSGYYIGRYEAKVVSSNSNTYAIKDGMTDFHNMTQQKAASMARNLYSNKNFVSDLVNSYAWDTAIVYIQNCSGDTDYSNQKHTNEEDVRCNIYDMGRNWLEWTTETHTTDNRPCVSRGGFKYGANWGTSTRIHDVATYQVEHTLRSILYF